MAEIDVPFVEKLTERGYWDGVHSAESRGRTRNTQNARVSVPARFKAAVKRLLGARFTEAIRNYDDYLLWEVILPRYLSGRNGARVVEIGSAPGDFLVRLHQRFGLIPCGVEYSPVGAAMNRAAFSAGGIDPANVIEEDFFGPGLHARHHETFDIVLSRGFIEHFTDPGEAIRRHLDLVRSRGLIVVSIPNLRGLNRWLSWFFDRKVLAMHNLTIMTKDGLARLFSRESVEPVFCGYYGTFNLRLFNARPNSPTWPILTLCAKAQPILNVVFRFLLKDRGAESRWSSPNLIFIGIKR